MVLVWSYFFLLSCYWYYFYSHMTHQSIVSYYKLSYHIISRCDLANVVWWAVGRISSSNQFSQISGPLKKWRFRFRLVLITLCNKHVCTQISLLAAHALLEFTNKILFMLKARWDRILFYTTSHYSNFVYLLVPPFYYDYSLNF